MLHVLWRKKPRKYGYVQSWGQIPRGKYPYVLNSLTKQCIGYAEGGLSAESSIRSAVSMQYWNVTAGWTDAGHGIIPCHILYASHTRRVVTRTHQQMRYRT